ncbi:LysR substrate-binding domain-containing protein [Pantoea sp. Mb-10]|uniref:LysR family transcriptional regulator n=1 Tax=unclassified Pantoea TaxID=2630326 RepID=UPI001E564031|nr:MULTISPECIES: LysR substrate-binding domain-containing protein [unclassified Pantoea]MCE0490860.1 LysR substrate-binding domain-containing protein [Pantoea sp. Mb-10]MCE0499982.1 LysR substrate-binding domain-containing protein [Pantoea sp. Pb-8]
MFAFSRFLIYFTEVARQGSLRKASEVLHVSASSIDRQILRVEEQLDMPLFERHPLGLCMTAAGEILFNAAKNWQRDFGRVCTQLEDLRGLRHGHVHIATIDAINRGFFSSILQRIREDYPGISFTLTTMSNIHIANALTAGDADFGIMLNPQSSRELLVKSFADLRLGIVVSRHHPLAALESIRFSHCEPWPFIVPAAPLMLADPLEALINSSGIRLKEVGRTNNIHMLRSLVRDDVGISLMCWLDIVDEYRRGELKFIPLIDTVLKPFTLSLCVAPQRQLSVAASMMLGQLELFFAMIENEEALAGKEEKQTG